MMPHCPHTAGKPKQADDSPSPGMLMQRLAGEKVKGVCKGNPGPIERLRGSDPGGPAGSDNPSLGMLAEAGWRES